MRDENGYIEICHQKPKAKTLSLSLSRSQGRGALQTTNIKSISPNTKTNLKNIFSRQKTHNRKSRMPLWYIWHVAFVFLLYLLYWRKKICSVSVTCICIYTNACFYIDVFSHHDCVEKSCVQDNSTSNPSCSKPSCRCCAVGTPVEIILFFYIYITLHFHKGEKALALRWYLVVGYNSASWTIMWEAHYIKLLK